MLINERSTRIGIHYPENPTPLPTKGNHSTSATSANTLAPPARFPANIQRTQRLRFLPAFQ